MDARGHTTGGNGCRLGDVHVSGLSDAHGRCVDESGNAMLGGPGTNRRLV